MNIQLSPDSALFVAEQLSAGSFQTADEVVDAALRVMKEARSGQLLPAHLPDAPAVDDCVSPPRDLPRLLQMAPVKPRTGRLPPPDPIDETDHE